MSDLVDRFTKISAAFTDRVDAVAPEAWDNPTPCEGWVARDIVAHLTEWVPAFLTDRASITFPDLPPAAEDPVGAWHLVSEAILAQLSDPAKAAEVHDTPMGPLPLDAMVDRFITSDVLIHTWDLARSTGLDEHLDPVDYQGMLAGMEPIDEVLRDSGHYGPKVPVASDADELTRLLGFLGRDPEALRRG